MSIAKAIVGAAVAGLSALAVALEDGALNPTEIVGAIAACLIALGSVWAIPNKPGQ